MDLKTRKFTNILTKDDFISAQVFSIQPENDTYVWLGTGSGLYRFNVKTNELRNFEMFPSQKGVEFNRFSTLQTKDGTLYFGSVEGLFAFHPKELIKASRIEERFPIQLSQLSKYDSRKDTIVHTYQDLQAISTIHIYPRHKYLNLEIFVPDFRDAEQNTYIWWLEGYEARWSTPSTANTIRYENLPVGKYTLHIRGGIDKDYYESS